MGTPDDGADRGPRPSDAGEASPDHHEPTLRASTTLEVAATVESDLGRGARPSAATMVPGSMLDANFRVMREIGRGAMGAVYEVEHVALGKRFAAKVLTEARTADEESIRRLQQEARAASAIDHENIVAVTHLGESADGVFFVVMELLQGMDLGRRMREAELSTEGSTRLPDTLARDVVRQILRGLVAAHEAGIVHRDLKPENVYLVLRHGDTRVKIVDFGISKLQDAAKNAVRLTQTGQVLGTPLYMAPEQTRGDSRGVDGRADLYSLGIIAYEITTGRHPFPAEGLYEILMMHANTPPPPPRLVRPDLPEAVERVILCALEKDPEARFADAAAMLVAWEAAWSGVLGPDDLVSGSGSGLVSGRLSLPAAAPSTARRSAQPPGWAVALGALALLGTGVGLTMALRPTPRDAPVVGARAPAAEPVDPDGALDAPPPTNAPSAGPAALTEGAPTPSPRTFLLQSTPPGADVKEDGASIGKTPLMVEVEPGAVRTFDVQRRGFRAERVTLDHASDGADQRTVVLTRLRATPAPSPDDLAPR